MNAIRQKIVVPANGVVEISAPELTPGTEAEVIVLIENGARSTPDVEDDDDGEMEGLVQRYDEAITEEGENVPLRQVLEEIKRRESA